MDLLIRGGQVVDVEGGTVSVRDVAIKDRRFVPWQGEEARDVVDAGGRVVAPGFIDGHIHIESSLLTPPAFARAVVPHGTAAVVADPHEIANVLGAEGLRYVLETARGLPLDIFVTLPSCVPATDLETSGAVLTAADLEPLFDHPWVVGLGEVMNYPGVLAGDPGLMAKIELALSRGKRVDGHAPGLSGEALSAYRSAGPASDHEAATAGEAAERLRAGFYLMLREGSGAMNLTELSRAVTGEYLDRCLIVTDDANPLHLDTRGHLDHALRVAVKAGIPPVQALRMVTLNPARYFRLGERGAIRPGYIADLVILDDLESMGVRAVYRRGELVAADGQALWPEAGGSWEFRDTMRLGPLREETLRIPARPGPLRVIRAIPGQILTEAVTAAPAIRDGEAVADPGRDLAKLAVIERHRASGRVGLGFVTGLGLRRGALASSVAHDSHNLIVAGADDASMLTAARRVRDLGGGMTVALQGEVLAELALPLAGLMTPQPLGSVTAAVRALQAAARGLGCEGSDSFMTLSFLALPVIPALRLTDCGLVDVGRFEHVGLWA